MPLVACGCFRLAFGRILGLWVVLGVSGGFRVHVGALGWTCVCFGELLAGFWGIGWFWDGLWPFECFGVVFGWLVSIRVLRCALGDLGRP